MSDEKIRFIRDARKELINDIKTKITKTTDETDKDIYVHLWTIYSIAMTNYEAIEEINMRLADFETRLNKIGSDKEV